MLMLILPNREKIRIRKVYSSEPSKDFKVNNFEVTKSDDNVILNITSGRADFLMLLNLLSRNQGELVAVHDKSKLIATGVIENVSLRDRTITVNLVWH